MRGSKAKALKRATARFILSNRDRLPATFSNETWSYTDTLGVEHLGPCPRKLYQVAKKKYKAQRRGYVG